MTYEGFLQRVLVAEVQAQEQRAELRRIRAAKLPMRKSLDAFGFSFQPTLIFAASMIAVAIILDAIPIVV
jgi:DNA replication protein DnaC